MLKRKFLLLIPLLVIGHAQSIVNNHDTGRLVSDKNVSHLTKRWQQVTENVNVTNKQILDETVFVKAVTYTNNGAKKSLGGHWKGNLSMIDHFHPLTLKFNVSDVNIELDYTFWGMDSKSDSKDIHKPQTIFSYKNEQFDIVLPDAGISLRGKQTSPSNIEANVFWLGQSQKVTFKKVDSTENTSMMQHQTNKKMNVAVLLFDNVDVLDWAGPLEVFVHAHQFNTFTVSAEQREIKGSGYNVIADYSFDNMPNADIVIIPGGRVSPLFLNEKTLNWIKEQGLQSKYIMSVYNASTLMAATGLLKGKQTTTHQSWLPWMQQLSNHHGYDVIDGQRFVDNGQVITTAGVSAGIDGALHIVAKLLGEPRAKMTAKMLEYNWQPTQEY